MNRLSARAPLRAIFYLLIAFATAMTLLIVLLSQLDLDTYRHSLEQQLSAALKQPVRIGHSSLTYNHGLALKLRQLQIGPDRTALAQIPQITATLKIAPLFNRQFILKEVQIDNPSFQLWLPFPDRPARGTSHQLINALGVSILTVRNANLIIYQKQGEEVAKRTEFSNLHAVLRGWQPGETGQLVMTGHLQRRAADFLLETRLPSSTDPDVWRQEEHKTHLQITHFSTQGFPKLSGQSYPESLDFNLDIVGAPATGTRFKALLTGAETAEQLFSLSGLWTSSSGQDSLTGLTGDLLRLPLDGEAHLIRQPEKNLLAGRFGTKNIKLNRQLLEAWRVPDADKLVKGELDRLSFKLEKTWNPSDKFSGLPKITAEIIVGSLGWDNAELKPLQDFSVDLSLDRQQLQINNGRLVAGGQIVDFTGQVDSLFMKPAVDVRFSFNPNLDEIGSYLKLSDDWKASGNIPGSLRLHGPLFSPGFQLQAELTSTALQFGSLFHKTTADRSSLQLQGEITDKRIHFQRSIFNLNDVHITATGDFQQNKGEQEYSFTTKLLDLKRLQPFSPLLQKLQVRGEIGFSLRQNQAGLRGALMLKDVGAHLTTVIGDLNKTTGEIDFDRHGLTFQRLAASLGESKFLVNGLLSNWKDPQLSLDLIGKKIRAQDLIFPNQKLTLYDLEGRLRINRDGISFAPIKVRLEEDTLATVFGEVNNFSNPRVNLDIQAETVDVLEIIDLFHGPHRGQNGPHIEKRPPIIIKASAKQGTLGGLRFTNAETLISDDNGMFTVYPIKFQNGEGWCWAKVEINLNQKESPLKISGHMEDINASVLHQDLFQKQGLINGCLRGDFYIEGDVGNDRFWQTAKGGLHLQISDGTLRKFHGLAKVFSLLNVSQIFAGKLPDMDKEGMPFSLLEGSIQIADGQLETEDLKITSEAMNLSLVGTHRLVDDMLNFNLGVMPLRTVDKVITSIPIAGWVLAGEEKALLTAHFKIEGTSVDPKVTPVPIDSVSNTVLGIFKRTLGLPGKLVKDIGSVFKNEPEKKVEP